VAWGRQRGGGEEETPGPPSTGTPSQLLPTTSFTGCRHLDSRELNTSKVESNPRNDRTSPKPSIHPRCSSTTSHKKKVSDNITKGSVARWNGQPMTKLQQESKKKKTFRSVHSYSHATDSPINPSTRRLLIHQREGAGKLNNQKHSPSNYHRSSAPKPMLSNAMSMKSTASHAMPVV